VSGEGFGINFLRVMRAAAAVMLVVNVAFGVAGALAGRVDAVFNAGVVVFLALVMCFQTFAIRRQRRLDRPRPDYDAIARMEREIFGEAAARRPSLLCPCGGTLPQHIRSPHYLPGYDAAGPLDPPESAWCYCNWCRGRPGVHGAEATALYRAQMSAALRRD
jgi:hypothetical protein